MDQKRISVVIPVYNALPYFRHTIDSVLSQTCDLTSIELVLVDDGSTDGSGEYIDELAASYPELVRAQHCENSGGPAHPRNVGIEMASAEYIFFLDADDYFGPEALDRMIQHVGEWKSDVLLVKQVGEGGRKAPQSMFRMNQPNANTWTSRVFNTLSPLKLFRSSLVKEGGIRFPEQYRHHEDAVFVAEALFRAKVVSVAADYDYCHIVQRDDGANMTSEAFVDFDDNYEMCKTMLGLVERYEPNPHDADAIIFPRILKSSWFGGLYAAACGDELEREKRIDLLAELIEQRYRENTAAKRIPNGLKDAIGFVLAHEYVKACACIELLKVTADSEFGGIDLDAGERSIVGGKLMISSSKGDVSLDATGVIPVNDAIESCVLGRGMRFECSCESNEFWSKRVKPILRIEARKSGESVSVAGKHVHQRRDGRIAYRFDIGKSEFKQMESTSVHLWDFSLVLCENGIERKLRFGGHMTAECANSIQLPAVVWEGKDGKPFQLRRTPAGNFAMKS